ncbi:D-Ala-D-Ala carboxypeptidase family metallohydrolase [Tenacibaculum amylolyticum]|uniref:D-Ala-D-Ala carboxypeptidase family metallohydrolase n=1 Tax=Tenacibaculum amylolyticum TaxID=104269 RepID=UPI003893EB65
MVNYPKEPLYLDDYGENVKVKNFLLSIPFDGVDKTTKLSKNLMLHEIVEAAFVTKEEQPEFNRIPYDVRLPNIFQILRDALGKPIYVTSSFRSKNHEYSKDRKGTSQHVLGKAWDLKGEGLVQLIKEAVETKNQLYTKLRNAGLNGLGIYNTFIHVDTRESQDLVVFTDNREGDKKKSLCAQCLFKITAIIALGAFVVVKTVSYLIKRKKK